MAFDLSYFDTLNLETVWRKRYEKSDVDKILAEVKDGVAELTGENDRLREMGKILADRVRTLEEEAAATETQKKEISETLLSAKQLSRNILADAGTEADEILAKAKAEAERLASEATARAEAIVREAEATRDRVLQEAASCETRTFTRYRDRYEQMRSQHEEWIALLDRDWQSFLCGLDPESVPAEEPAEAAPATEPGRPEEAPAEAPAEPAEADEPVEEPAEAAEEDVLPKDLADKIDAILSTLNSFNDDNEA